MINHWQDEQVRQKNIEQKLPLCDRCEGTGNEFLMMYKKCEECQGIGVRPIPEGGPNMKDPQ